MVRNFNRIIELVADILRGGVPSRAALSELAMSDEFIDSGCEIVSGPGEQPIGIHIPIRRAGGE